MRGGSRKRRHHSKPGPRLDPTRLITRSYPTNNKTVHSVSPLPSPAEARPLRWWLARSRGRRCRGCRAPALFEWSLSQVHAFGRYCAVGGPFAEAKADSMAPAWAKFARSTEIALCEEDRCADAVPLKPWIDPYSLQNGRCADRPGSRITGRAAASRPRKHKTGCSWPSGPRRRCEAPRRLLRRSERSTPRAARDEGSGARRGAASNPCNRIGASDRPSSSWSATQLNAETRPLLFIQVELHFSVGAASVRVDNRTGEQHPRALWVA